VIQVDTEGNSRASVNRGPEKGDMRTFFLLLLLELLGVNELLRFLSIGAGVVVTGSGSGLALLGRGLLLAGRDFLFLGGSLGGG
jgi:hypothetical protein